MKNTLLAWFGSKRVPHSAYTHWTLWTALAFCLATLRTAAATGDVDSGFNPNVTGGSVWATAVQADGKILLGGDFTGVNGEVRNRLARLNADGTVESTNTFNPSVGVNGSIWSMAVQLDGKILLGGFFTSVNGQTRNRIARLNADGSLEITNNFNPGTGANDYITSVTVQPDGKILLGGNFSSVDGQTRNRIARLNADGTLESTNTFNPGTGPNALATSIVLQPDGKILLSGGFTTVNGQARNRIARLNADGTVESTSTFNPGTGANSTVFCIVLQADGKILLGGDFTTFNGQSYVRIVRLNPDGSPAALDPGAIASDRVWSMAVQADGKILIGGVFTTPGPYIARLNPSGSVESAATFNTGTGPNAQVTSVAVQADGKILLGGNFTSVNGQSRNGVARLLNDPSVEAITVFNTSRVKWSRSGAGPEVAQATFELSTNGGGNWIPLGAGTRVAGGWERTGLNLPKNGSIRAHGRTAGGFQNGSFGMVERSTNYTISSNANLAALVLTPGLLSPPFAETTIGYTANVSYATANLAVTPTVADAFSTVMVNGLIVTSGVPSGPTSLNVGTNNIAIVVTAQDGTTVKTYSVMVIRSAASPGDVEMEFTPDINGTIRATAVQPDGKILIGGTFTSVNNQPCTNLARLNADGTLESTNTFNCRAVNNIGLYSLAVQADGKILIGGSFTSVNGEPRTNIARLNADGTVESTNTFNVGMGANNFVFGVAVQTDGKILLGGRFTTVDGQTRNHIARLNADGTVESTGTFNPGTGASGLEVDSVAVQTDGKIVLGGNFTSVNGQTRNRIARLNADGTVEDTNTFNLGSGVAGIVHSVAVQSDGKILIGGSFNTVNSQPRTNIVRLNSDGSVEGTNTFLAAVGGAGTLIYSIAAQADGKILMGGIFTSVNGQPRTNFARLNADGVMESANPLNLGLGPNGGVRSVTMQANGEILLTGDFTAINSQPHNRMARLANVPALQVLAVPNPGRVLWSRSGAAPEIEQVTFELSADSGASWSPLGSGARIVGGWERTGLTLPANGSIRARGRTVSGYQNGSAGLVEMAAAFSPAPEIGVEQPAGTNLANSAATVNFGTVYVGANGILIFTITNSGTANLTGLGVTINGANSNDFSVTASPTATVSPNGSTSFTVTFTPGAAGARAAMLHIVSNDGDETPFDIGLIGEGLIPQPPTINCGQNETFAIGTSWNFTVPNVTANCGNALLSILSTATNQTCGRTFTATRIWLATNTCGMSATCTQVVSIIDMSGPTISCPSNITVQCGGGIPPADFAGGTVFDDGDPNLTVIHIGDVSSGVNPRIITRSYRVTDACSNSTVCSQTITVHDTNAPTITCPADIVVAADTNACIASGVALGASIVADNCTVTFTNDAPATFPLGITLVTWTATDAAGNSVTCTQRVTVVDASLAITAQPQGSTNNVGTDLTLAVTAAGCPERFYQWRFGTNVLAGKTNTALALTNIQTTQAGGYSVEISNAGGSITSAVAVLKVNTAPVLPGQRDQTIAELITLIVTNAALDPDVPSNVLSYQLMSPPDGASIGSNGVIVWMPTELQGPGTNTFTTVVTDEGGLTATNSFNVFVTEVNTAPVLDPITNRTIDPGAVLVFTARATDADQPANTLSFSLLTPLAGASIETGGLFHWRPAMTRADTTNVIGVRVQDDGSPSLSATNSFVVIVNPLGPVVLKSISFTNNFQFEVSGTIGPDYIIMASRDLIQWTDIATNFSPVTPFRFTNGSAGTFSNRFYKLRLAP